MGADAVAIGVVTGFWAVVGIILPFILGKGPNKGVIQVVLVITASTCWLFWLLCYMHQMNPLIGPQLENTTVLAIRYLWDKNLDIDDLPTPHPTEPTTTHAAPM
ncbi:hypothetical protein SK128_027474 [Halocaridina rubra]|uniref:V-type proton ATPase subunit n=1 Tax=Halocaridina rubra TaxID=373956 RepID=A0AAN8WVN6_HALRR